MNSKKIRFVGLLLLLFLVVPVVATAQPDPNTVIQEVNQPNADPPTVLVDGYVQRSTVQNAKVWWWYTLACAPTRSPAADWRLEEIARVPTTGGLIRTVFAHDEPSPYCGDWNPELFSNIAADDDYIYWMSNEHNGLVKLSVEANEGDPATLLYAGQQNADEIAERGNYVYLMDDAYGIIRVHKTTGTATPLFTTVQLGGASSDLQVTDEFLFWRVNSNGFLKVGSINGNSGDGIITGVTSYIAENSLCPPGGPCNSTEYVFVAQGEIIRRYDVDSQAWSSVLYDSPISGSSVEDITVDDSKLYFFERRTGSCNPFCTYDYALFRMNRTGGATSLLYYLTGQYFSSPMFDLTLGGPDNDYLFWQDEGKLKRLPRDATAIPSVDVYITDIEVTQSIQDLDNSVPLIREKRTGVRVHVDAAGQNVPGIAAELYRINGSGYIIDGPIYPSAGTNYLTVQNNPDRATFDHAFYFELPNDWIDDSTLRLRAEINPNKLPMEPNYSNNAQNTATLTVQASPTLRTHLLVWGYTVNGNYYQPNTVQDVWQARSWIRRVYPLASTTGGYDSPEPGFRLAVRTINDANLGEHIQRTSELCLDIPVDDREFCAATYTNNYAKWLRGTEGIPANELIYSMIWNEPALPFPRGFATGGVSSGPTGTGTWGWDNDGSYGDWYMGHEVGHNVGRGHPSQGNACGHSASDPGFPYAGAAIGSGDMWGFDVGDIGLNGALTRRVYPNSQWRDMMSYCDRQWISDYTYEGIYNFLTTVNAASQTSYAPARAGADVIALFGSIYDEADTASFQVVGLWDSSGPYSPPSGGPYTMRFLDGSNMEIANYDFTGEATDADPNTYGFEVVVPFPANTAVIELIRQSDNAVLATHALSANPPTISDVELVNPTNPLTGTVTLQWQASDPDGDPLTFDVYYTDDGGSTYAAYAVGLSSDSVELDTLQMAGSSTAQFRVTANDGTRMAEAESAPFVMADKPPMVTILTPEDGLEITYGTPVNFVAEVEDLQGYVPDGNMGWNLNGSFTGITGPSYTAYLLPVGTNEITIQAINGAGQITSKSVTVIVNDNLEYPGPTLSVGPDQFSWQVAEGTTNLQQATLTVSNIGTGNLNWSASEDASWLSLSASSGGTPASITLTVDPSGAGMGVPLSTMITISGDNGQSIQIPVSLLAGVNPVWDPPSKAVYSIWLPTVIK